MFKKPDAESNAGEARKTNLTSRPTNIIRHQEPTPIGPTIHISGHIRGNQDLIVHGHVEGTINIGEGVLIITSEGQIDADVNARIINVEGRAEGKLQASEQINVRRSARVRGGIEAPRIALDFGCSFSGSIDTDSAYESASISRDDKIADFKSAICTSADTPAKSAMGKGTPR